MLYYQIALMSASILIAAITGGIRLKKIDPVYYPVISCFCIASANEILSFILTQNGCHTVANNNIYVLIEAILLTIQFKKWGLFSNKKYAFTAIIGLFIITWGVECCYSRPGEQLFYYFRIMYSFAIVLMSIHLNNSIIYTCRGKLLSSAVFRFCSGFVIFFSGKIVMEACWLYGTSFSDGFLTKVFLILSWINLAVNFIYTSAILCIPSKKTHTMLF